MTDTKVRRDERQPLPADPEEIVARVRQRYASLARGGDARCCLPPGGAAGDACAGDRARRLGYDPTDLDAVPEAARYGLGCGAPVPHLDPRRGEVVLDLGSGGGLDAFLAARRVGPTGRVIGVDMTPEMIRRARQNARRAGLHQVEFREGRLEALPVDDASVDAVTSNCVINLVPDKATVFREISRVLRPGGRLVIADILLDGSLPEPIARDLAAYTGCVAGAMLRQEYFATVRAAGLADIEVLSDVDLLARVGGRLPEGLGAMLRSAGVEIEALRGKVRSVVFRAVKG